MASAPIYPRHIQDMSEAASLEPHWGYADRAMPCTNDQGSCDYLDVVYRSHDLGMYYTGIFWATVGGILIVWAIGRQFLRRQPSGVQLPMASGEGPRVRRSALERMQHAIPSYARRYLLPDAARPIFGRTTRTQVLVLAVLTGYLTIWTFVGVVYGTWVTPVKKMPGVYNIRTSLGAFADRVGVLAYALTPLSVMLSSRESILSLITGLPYQSFNFLHRWLGYIIFAQSGLHTIAWCVVEMRLYQPQPSTGLEWIVQPYMIWGVVAMFILTLLVVLSTPWGIRVTGYEFFRKAHYILAMFYIGACWGHWEQLKVFLLPSLIVWFLDRGVRLARTALLHYNFLSSGHMGFRCATAKITFFENKDATNGDIIRLDFEHPHDAWDIGQHFYLCFPESTVWQSHPFTPLSLPIFNADVQTHSYIFRARKGETRRIAELSARRTARTTVPESTLNTEKVREDATLSVVLNGPYGEQITRDLENNVNVLCIAGGTGITYVMPVLLDLVARPRNRDRRISLVWVVRNLRDLDWVAPELEVLKRHSKALGLRIHIYVTRETQEQLQVQQKRDSDSSVSSMSTPKAAASHLEKDTDVIEIGQRSRPTTTGSSSASTTASGSSGNPLSIHGVSKAAVGLGHVLNRPNLRALLKEFVAQNVVGRTEVIASGPGEMISDLRSIVAGLNRGKEVWKGDEKSDIRLICDDRLEW